MQQSDPFPPQVTASPTVDGSACYKCGYSLRGIATTGVCPECGTPVADSLRGVLLQYASPEYLAALLKGHSLVLNGILLMIIATIATVCVAAGAGAAAGAAGGGNVVGLVGVLVPAVQLAVAVMIFFGYLKLTEPDPRFTGADSPDGPRKWVRIAAIASIVCSLLGFLVAGAGFFAGGGLGGGAPGAPVAAGAAIFGLLGIVVSVLGFVAFAVQFFAMMRYMRWLGTRVPDAWIMRRTKTYMWLLPVLQTVGVLLVGLGPLIALVLYWNLLDRMRKHLKSITNTGEPAVLKGVLG
jgi:hypothetical protein